MSREHRELVQRFVEEVFNRGNFDDLSDLVTSDYVHHDPTTGEFGSGIEGFKQLINYYRKAFPDLKIALDDQIVAKDMVVDRWTGSGTHEGELMGIAPTRKNVTATGISIHRISGGKIAETWNQYDAFGMLKQLGVMHGMSQT